MFHKSQIDVRTRQTGAGLIEVIVAVLVFSLGLVGILRLQIGAMRNAESAYTSNQAALLAYTMLDALRADRAAAAEGSYNIPKTCTNQSSGKTGLARSTLDDWLNAIKATLGDQSGTCGEVTCNNTSCSVNIYWDDSRALQGSTGANIEVRSQL